MKKFLAGVVHHASSSSAIRTFALLTGINLCHTGGICACERHFEFSHKAVSVYLRFVIKLLLVNVDYDSAPVQDVAATSMLGGGNKSLSNGEDAYRDTRLLGGSADVTITNGLNSLAVGAGDNPIATAMAKARAMKAAKAGAAEGGGGNDGKGGRASPGKGRRSMAGVRVRQGSAVVPHMVELTGDLQRKSSMPNLEDFRGKDLLKKIQNKLSEGDRGGKDLKYLVVRPMVNRGALMKVCLSQMPKMAGTARQRELGDLMTAHTPDTVHEPEMVDFHDVMEEVMKFWWAEERLSDEDKVAWAKEVILRQYKSYRSRVMLATLRKNMRIAMGRRVVQSLFEGEASATRMAATGQVHADGEVDDVPLHAICTLKQFSRILDQVDRTALLESHEALAAYEQCVERATERMRAEKGTRESAAGGTAAGAAGRARKEQNVARMDSVAVRGRIAALEDRSDRRWTHLVSALADMRDLLEAKHIVLYMRSDDGSTLWTYPPQKPLEDGAVAAASLDMDALDDDLLLGQGHDGTTVSNELLRVPSNRGLLGRVLGNTTGKIVTVDASTHEHFDAAVDNAHGLGDGCMVLVRVMRKRVPAVAGEGGSGRGSWTAQVFGEGELTSEGGDEHKANRDGGEVVGVIQLVGKVAIGGGLGVVDEEDEAAHDDPQPPVGGAGSDVEFTEEDLDLLVENCPQLSDIILLDDKALDEEMDVETFITAEDFFEQITDLGFSYIRDEVGWQFSDA
jgi:hypothetical protein